MTEEGIGHPVGRGNIFMLHQGAFYHCQTLARDLEKALQFVVPMAHVVAAMSRCHRGCRASGPYSKCCPCCRTSFSSLDMVRCRCRRQSVAVQKVYSTQGCLSRKLPYKLFWSPLLLKLFHVDFTDIEMTMELDWPPHVVNVLVFCDHFTRHIMAYVTPD